VTDVVRGRATEEVGGSAAGRAVGSAAGGDEGSADGAAGWAAGQVEGGAGDADDWAGDDAKGRAVDDAGGRDIGDAKGSAADDARGCVIDDAEGWVTGDGKDSDASDATGSVSCSTIIDAMTIGYRYAPPAFLTSHIVRSSASVGPCPGAVNGLALFALWVTISAVTALVKSSQVSYKGTFALREWAMRHQGGRAVGGAAGDTKAGTQTAPRTERQTMPGMVLRTGAGADL
jgi:hypothetical protein